MIGSIVGGSTSTIGAFLGGLFITFVPTWTSNINLALGNVNSCGSIELKKHWEGKAGSTTLKIKDSSNNELASTDVSGADLPRPPLLVRRQIGEIGAMALAGMDNVKALAAHHREQPLDRLDRGAC